MKNSGIDIDVLGYPVKTKNGEIGLEVQYTYNQNKLINNNGEEITAAKKLAGTAYIEGQALRTLYSYDFAGLSPENGLPIFYDNNGSKTTVINGQEVPNYTIYQREANLVKSGTLDAPSFGSLKFMARYKNLRLTTNFTYQFGGVNRLPALYTSGNYDNVFDPAVNVSKEFMNRWKQSGDENYTNIPALYDERTYQNLLQRPTYVTSPTDSYNSLKGIAIYDQSTARVAKTDFLRLSSVSLTYIFTDRICDRLRIQNMSVSLQATNLFLWTDKMWYGRDPQNTSKNASLPRTFTLNVNMSF